MSTTLIRLACLLGSVAVIVAEPPFDHCLCQNNVLDCSPRTRFQYHSYRRKRSETGGNQSNNPSRDNTQNSDSQNNERVHNNPSGDRIPYIDVQSLCPNATDVRLKYLNLRQFPDGLQNVTKIDISSNSLIALPDASLLGVNTKYLDFSENNLVNANDEFHHLAALEDLRLGWNKLKHLRFLPNPCSLRSLDARVNHIASVAGSLRQCRELRTLLLFATNITELPDDVFAGLVELRRIAIRTNPIVSISPKAFIGLPQLENLDLSNTELTTLPEKVFAELGKLQILSFSDNSITALPENTFEGLIELQSLRLTQSLRNLISLPGGLFSPLTNLRELYLDGNGLTSLPENIFQHLGHLEELHLERNKLQLIPDNMFATLGSLKVLRINRNRLSVLPSSLFSSLSSLRELDASNNELTALPEMGECCVSLESASFYYNSVAMLSESAVRALLGESGRRDVDLRENPIRTSSLLWVLGAGAVYVEPYVDAYGGCKCGGLWRLDGAGGRDTDARIRFCVEAPCGRNSTFRDWIAAVRGVN